MNINLLLVGPLSEKLHHKILYTNLVRYVTNKFRKFEYDTTNLSNKIIDIKKIVDKNKNNNTFLKTNETIIFFIAGAWLGNKNNKIINHDEYYKLYDIFDQKIDKQLNVILKPNKFNGFLYRYKGIEMDTLIKLTPKMSHYYWPPYCDSSKFKNWDNEKIYDILFYGSYNGNYPLRMKLLNIVINLSKKKLINFRLIHQHENFIEEKLSNEINKSWLCITTKTGKHDRFLTKYQEIPFSFSCILGNIPTKYRDLLENNIIEVDDNMSDLQIENIILKTLKNKKEILAKTDRLHKKLKSILSYENGKKDFEEIITKISNNLDTKFNIKNNKENPNIKNNEIIDYSDSLLDYLNIDSKNYSTQ